MKTPRRPSVPMSEQIKLINACRKSGMSDAAWCREHDISPSTFYNWISRCRKAAADKIPEPGYGQSTEPLPRQDVVPVRILPDQTTPVPLPEKAGTNLDNSHTIEIMMKDLTIRIRNDADPVLVAHTLRIMKEAVC